MSKQIHNIDDLVNDELSAVSCVRDYVEFHFDGPVLRALSDPQLEVGGTRVQFPGEGSRDALCALIGRQVTRAEVIQREYIRLEFGDARLTISLRQSDLNGPEAAHLMGYPDGMAVW